MLMYSILSLLLPILSFLPIFTNARRGDGWQLTVDLHDATQGSTSGTLVAGQSTSVVWDVYDGAPSQIMLVLSNDDPSKADSIPFYSNANVNWRQVTANLPVVPPGSNYYIECDSPRGVWCGATNYFSVVAPPPVPSPSSSSPVIHSTTTSSTPTPSSTVAKSTSIPPISSSSSSSPSSPSLSSGSQSGTQLVTSSSANLFRQQTTSIQVSVTITVSSSSSALPASTSENSSPHKVPLGAIIGAAAGGGVFVIIIAVLVFVLCRRRRGRGVPNIEQDGYLTPFQPQNAVNLSEKGQMELLVREREAAILRKEQLARGDSDRQSTNSNTGLLYSESLINVRIEELNQQIMELRQRNSDLEHSLQPPPEYQASTSRV